MEQKPLASSGQTHTAVGALLAASHDPLLTTVQAAKELNVSASYLAKLRSYGGGPLFLKVGRCIRYRREDLARWVQSKTRASTSA